MLAPTHLFFALALAYILKLPKLPAAIAGIAVDLDIVFNLLDTVFPFTHRGLIHTPLFLATVAWIFYYITKNKEQTRGIALGYASHLFLDVITPAGIILLFPITAVFSLNAVGYSNLVANTGMILLSIIFIFLFRTKKKHSLGNRYRFLCFLIFIISTCLIAYLGGFFPHTVYDPFLPLY